MRRRKAIRVILFLALTTMVQTGRGQGSLDPPAGVPGPTMRSLDQIEPRTPITNLPCSISSSGSYVLIADLTATSSADGITVSADDVSIDLRGFALDGASTGSSGISQSSSYRNLTVCNGTLVNWTSYGVEARGCDGRIRNVTAAACHSGIYAGSGSLVQSCMSVSNDSASSSVCFGYYLDSSVTMEDSLSGWNYGGSYGYGIYAKGNCSIMRCRSCGNDGGNAGYGIYAQTNSIVSGCTVHDNGQSSPNGQGIEFVGGGMVIRCSVCKNGSNTINEAIYINGDGGSVIDCQSCDNGGRGIMVDDNCLVRGNTCLRNHTGIYTYGSRNRVEGNTCNHNSSVGISVLSTLSTNNVVICNSASGNGDNYSVTTSKNIVGPESTSITNHPWANFSLD